MENPPKLGRFVSGNTPRDAVHIAVIPVEAGQDLRPGERVSVVDDKAVRDGNLIGIVDPFLLGNTVPRGKVFWLLLFPDTVVSLHHEWRHPTFDGPIAESERWLKQRLKTLGTDESYDELVAAVSQATTGDYCFGTDDYEDLMSDDEFWFHLSRVTGKNLDKEECRYSFRCAC